MSTKLTRAQSRILQAAISRHNVCILGRAGVGKSTVVNEIKKEFDRNGYKTRIVCSTSVACQEFHGMAKTIHSQYGLQTAELSAHKLIERYLERQNVVEDLKDCDVLIWDEISMCSERLFNLVNIINQKMGNNKMAFGGVQMVLVGDFWQLKPIPNEVDAGDPIFESNLFKKVFPHRYELTEVLRQEEAEIPLKRALDQIRMGKCDPETEAWLSSLTREFPSSTNEVPLHIYFKRLPADVHNAEVLASLDGLEVLFESHRYRQRQAFR